MIDIFEVEVIACKELGMVKCPRCYHWSHSMNFDNLCNRCVAIITKHHPDLESFVKIVENLDLRGMKPEDNPEWSKTP